jgi:hypothetical protein
MKPRLRHRLTIDGGLLDTFALPARRPRGVTIAANRRPARSLSRTPTRGFDRLPDPVTGLRQMKGAPAQSPQEITYGATAQKMLWHVDGQSRMIYRLNPETAQVFDAFGQTYQVGLPRCATCRSCAHPRARQVAIKRARRPLLPRARPLEDPSFRVDAAQALASTPG